jgi:hypothetical protein
VKTTLDFLVIGAQKAGTTTLFEHLRQHPDLALPSGKEHPFFSDDAAFVRGWRDYLSLIFPVADPRLKWGTVTPQYMVGGLLGQPNAPTAGDGADERTVPRRISETLPDIRLIAILRDPAERARSHYRMLRLNQTDKRPFEQAINDLLHPQALDDARRHPREATGCVTWGEYGRILAGYFDVFPREQILVLFTTELDSHPERLLARIYEFLGVRADFVPDNIGVRYRVGATGSRLPWLAKDSRVSPWTIRNVLAGNSATRRAWQLLPLATRRQIHRTFWRSTQTLDLWNRRAQIEDGDSDRVTLERLRTHYARDTQQLTALLGTSPPW